MLQNQLKELLLNQSTDAYWIVDKEFKLIYANKAYLELASETYMLAGELEKSIFLERVSENELEKWQAHFNKALNGETFDIQEHYFSQKSNVNESITINLKPLLDNENLAFAVSCHSRNITAQRNEKTHLKLLESVITNTNDAVLITEAEPLDEPGPKIIFVNEAFTKMTGYSSKEVIGKTPRLLQGPNSDRKELAKLGRSLRKWEPCEITTINYKKTGEEFWINFTVCPVANDQGWYTHWIAIERDVTEQKNKELDAKLFTRISEDFGMK